VICSEITDESQVRARRETREERIGFIAAR
jgi:hypothetical protein